MTYPHIDSLVCSLSLLASLSAPLASFFPRLSIYILCIYIYICICIYITCTHKILLPCLCVVVHVGMGGVCGVALALRFTIPAWVLRSPSSSRSGTWPTRRKLIESSTISRNMRQYFHHHNIEDDDCYDRDKLGLCATVQHAQQQELVQS